MSFAVFQQLTQTQVVDACIFASFTAPDANNLIVSKADRLEVYDVLRKQHKLSLVYSFPLFGRPEAIGSFRPREGAAEHLVVVLRRARYLAVLRHEPSFGSARTCGQHLLIPTDDPASISGPVGFRPQVAVDPAQRCLAVRVLPDRVLVFPVADGSSWQQEVQPAVAKHGALAFHEDVEVPPCLGAPFILGNRPPLRLHHIQDIAFLHGYHQPTAVCLGQTKPSYGGCLSEANLCTSSVLVFTLDLTERVPHLIWASHRLPHDIFRVMPLPLPIGGMLALCSNAVIYMKEHGTSFGQALNPCADLGDELAKMKGVEIKDEKSLEIQLTGCSATVLSPTTILFSVLPLGRLYCAHLVLESREVVADIIWTSPGAASPAAAMCSLGEEYVFVACSAAAGGCSLLKLTPSRKKLPPNLQKQQPSKRQRTDEPGETEPEKQHQGDAEAKAEKGPSECLKELLAAHKLSQDAGRHIRSYNFEISDDVAAFGAIPCLAPWCRDRGEEGDEEEAAPLAGTERLICCSGSGQKGALCVFQRAVPLDVLTEFDLPETSQFSAVWTLQHPTEDPLIAEAGSENPAKDEVLRAAAAAEAAAGTTGAPSHRLVLVSGGFKTVLLETTEEIEEVSRHTRLDTDATTVAAGSTCKSRCVVQVTPLKLCFLWASDPRRTDVPPPVLFDTTEGIPVQACGGAVSDPYVVVRFHDFHLRLFAAYGDAGCPELTDRLPEAARSGVVCASLFRGHSSRTTLLVVLTAADRGTLLIVDLETMQEVFRALHLLDVPPALRNYCGRKAGLATDHLRAFSDVCAPLPRGIAERAVKSKNEQEHLTAEELQGQRDAAASAAICAEFVDVDAEDCGPTLVVQLVGRPVLIYRPFVARVVEEGNGFPYNFSIFEHDLLGLVERTPDGPHRPVSPLRQPNGAPGGAVVLPPHDGIPALWLAARRNQLFMHPLPGTRIMGFSQLKAPCCGSGFFALSVPPDGSAVAAQVLAPSVAGGLQGSALQGSTPAFDLQWPIPIARHLLKRTPHVLATKPDDGLLGIAVSDTVLESSLPPGDDENDPLAEDWSIVRNPPVEFSAPPMPRSQPRFELWIDDAKNISKLGRYRFPFEHGEHVLCMEWVNILGFPSPSLAVGTGFNVGEDLTCRGRILIFSTRDRDPGILPAVYQRALKSPVTVVGQMDNYFVHAEGFKLFFEKWENGAFQKLAFFDSSMCVTSIGSIRSFLLLGDLRRGLDFVQWKEEKDKNTRNLRRLSRSPPSGFMSVLACDFMVCGKSLGLLALDHKGTAHLYQYTPHSDGREGDQLLRSCATFSMGFPCRSAVRLNTDAGVQCVFMASGGGELLCLRPIDDQVYRILATLLGMLSTRLPYRCGLNPRAFRHHEGPPALVAPRKNIEDGVLLRQFAFLSTPLQDAIAEKMRLPLLTLLRASLPCATCQLLSLTPQVASKTGAVVPA